MLAHKEWHREPDGKQEIGNRQQKTEGENIIPFEKPSAGGSIFDVQDGRYLVKVKDLEDTAAGEFGPGIKWVLNVATMDREMVKDDRGFDAEFWQFTSAKLTPRSKGRPWVEAFLGRELDETRDDGESIMAELKGKWAIALLAHDAQRNGRMYIVNLNPIKAAAKQPAAATAGNTKGSAPSPSAPASSPDEVPDDLLDVDASDDIPFA